LYNIICYIIQYKVYHNILYTILCNVLYNNIIILSTGELIQTIGRESLDMNDSVCDIAVYKDRVFLGCDNDGVRKYTMTY